MHHQHTLQEMIALVSDVETSVEEIAGRIQSDEYNLVQGSDWEIVDDICEGVLSNQWEQLTLIQRTNRIFEIIEVWPSYSTASHLHRFFMYTENFSSNDETHLWLKILEFLECLDTPKSKVIEYALWVDFFEDSKNCERTWNGLMSLVTDKAVRNRLLVNAGPVPYALKKPIYDKIAQYPDEHPTLAESLARSLGDVFGSIDRKDAKSFLSILELPPSNKFVAYLVENL